MTSATIEVVVPTAASIVAGEDIVVESDLERDELEALERAERVEGLVRIALPEGLEGEAEPTVFALELTRDGARVAGIGELLARSSGGAANAVVEGSTRLSGRPWLSLEPREIGRTTVTVEVAAERFVEFEVEVVSAESVRSIEIVGRPGRAVGAVARDAEGRRVFGVAPEWSVDGQRVGQGHRVPLVEEAGQRLLRVCLSEDVCDELVLPNLTPTLAFDGNDLPPAPVSSCAQASGAAPMFGLLFVGLALLRRRRR